MTTKAKKAKAAAAHDDGEDFELDEPTPPAAVVEVDVSQMTTPTHATAVVAGVRAAAQQMLVVEDTAGATALGEYLAVRVQPVIKRVKEIFAEPKAAARKTMDAVAKAERDLLQPLEEIKAQAKAALAEWAQRAALEARQREAAMIEQAQAVAREMRASEAAALEAQGEAALAEAVRAMELPAIAATTSGPPKVRGVAMRDRWEVDVTDLRALCRAIGEGTVPVDAVQVNQSFANAQAQAARGNLAWPGVRCTLRTQVSARRL